MEKKTLSIITVTLNNAKTIEKTIFSLKLQTFKDFEHIVVDGGSSDKTIEIIQSLSPSSIVIKNPGASLYGSLNKGILLSKGRIITWLHGDDYYANPSVLEKVVSSFIQDGIDICYGNVIYVDPETQKITRIWKAGSYSSRKFYYGWMPPHTSIFVSKKFFEYVGLYREDMIQSADYEWLLRALLKNKPFVKYIPETLVVMQTGGISNKNLYRRIIAHIEDWKAWRINGIKPYPFTLTFKVLRKLVQFI